MKKDKNDTSTGSFFWVYAVGALIWALTFPLFYIYRYRSTGYDAYHLWYLIPYLLGITILVWNAWRWKNSDENKCGNYKTEVDIIEFAERNTSYLLIAISFISYISSGNIGVKEYFFLISLFCAVGGVLPLYWIPKNRVENLMFLRHLKTVPYTYSICFFLAGITSILGIIK